MLIRPTLLLSKCFLLVVVFVCTAPSTPTRLVTEENFFSNAHHVCNHQHRLHFASRINTQLCPWPAKAFAPQQEEASSFCFAGDALQPPPHHHITGPLAALFSLFQLLCFVSNASTHTHKHTIHALIVTGPQGCHFSSLRKAQSS